MSQAPKFSFIFIRSKIVSFLWHLNTRIYNFGVKWDLDGLLWEIYLPFYVILSYDCLIVTQSVSIHKKEYMITVLCILYCFGHYTHGNWIILGFSTTSCFFHFLNKCFSQHHQIYNVKYLQMSNMNNKSSIQLNKIIIKIDKIKLSAFQTLSAPSNEENLIVWQINHIFCIT